MPSYVDRSGRVESSVVSDDVAEQQRVGRVPVKVAVVDVHRLNDGEAVTSGNTVARRRVATGRTPLVSRLVTQPPSPQF